MLFYSWLIFRLCMSYLLFHHKCNIFATVLQPVSFSKRRIIKPRIFNENTVATFLTLLPSVNYICNKQRSRKAEIEKYKSLPFHDGTSYEPVYFFGLISMKNSPRFLFNTTNRLPNPAQSGFPAQPSAECEKHFFFLFCCLLRSIISGHN